jgi:hypothetical protein
MKIEIVITINVEKRPILTPLSITTTDIHNEILQKGVALCVDDFQKRRSNQKYEKIKQ